MALDLGHGSSVTFMPETVAEISLLEKDLS
jgi:hypothetical protein